MLRHLVALILVITWVHATGLGSADAADRTQAARPAAAKPSASKVAPSTLAAVKARGTLRCGASAALEGFGQIDAKGHWSGFDIDICRAIAAAILGDPSKVEFIPLTANERFHALQTGQIDVLSRNTTWTLTREAGDGLIFAGVSYFDGQGFLVRRGLGVTSALALKSDTICVQQDTTTELNLADFFRQRGLKYVPKAYPTAAEVEEAYRKGRCGAYTTDASALFVMRSTLKQPDDSIILPEIISKEPLGPRCARATVSGSCWSDGL
jgi:ABC-type amino acid transport/signal transduction systems, periplasmic component/domain